ncbi:helix-turn-helix domain-containing protein [Paraburkholderia sp. BL25I1N1]|uniref:helix-turn-helix domain-containing protein n=1 Tax=Paraburkholderia sp. BL25I1N1 TaxID=1938804 RepID=UPI000D4B0FF0|nr:AraC-like DNA-binding protein [Paraburkholderia sp. BL25I1N1]
MTTFSGSITCGRVGAARFGKVAATPSMYCGQSALGAELSPLFVALQTNGESVLGDGTSRVALSASEWTIFDGRRPFAISGDRPMELIFINLPGLGPTRSQDPLAYPTFESLGTSGSARIFSDLVTSLFREFEHVDEAVAMASVENLRLLFSDACRVRFPGALLPVEAQRRAMIDYIERHLPDPELSPASIAREFETSVRQLHRVFKGTCGETVGEYIWKRRIHKCADELRCAGNAADSVTTIAFRWGFSSSPHFSRAFKDEFGQTASAYRRSLPNGPAVTRLT